MTQYCRIKLPPTTRIHLARKMIKLLLKSLRQENLSLLLARRFRNTIYQEWFSLGIYAICPPYASKHTPPYYLHQHTWFRQLFVVITESNISESEKLSRHKSNSRVYCWMNVKTGCFTSIK